MALLLAFPLTVAVIFGAAPDWKALGVGLLATAPMYWAVGAIETVTFVPMLGAGGSYLSFVTGNISNLKLPVALNALEQADVKINSEEGEVVWMPLEEQYIRMCDIESSGAMICDTAT